MVEEILEKLKLPKLKIHSYIFRINILLTVIFNICLFQDSGELSEPFINTLYHLTYTVRIAEEVLKWLLLSITIGSLTLLLLEVKKCIKK